MRRTLQRMGAQLVHLVSSTLGDDVVGRSVRRSVLRAAGAEIGSRATVHGGTYISRPAMLVLGAESFVGRHCYFDLEARLVLGAGVTVGHGTTFVTTVHTLGPPQQRCGGYRGSSITVGDGAWLGANVTVLPGVEIGRGAVVAAGAVVTHDVPPNMVVAGVPARVHRSLDPAA